MGGLKVVDFVPTKLGTYVQINNTNGVFDLPDSWTVATWIWKHQVNWIGPILEFTSKLYQNRVEPILEFTSKLYQNRVEPILKFNSKLYQTRVEPIQEFTSKLY